MIETATGIKLFSSKEAFEGHYIVSELPYFTALGKYRTRAIITRSWFETALDYKLQNLDPKIEEFPCLVHKFAVTPTALQYKPQWKMG